MIKTLLIAEDEDVMRSMLVDYLEDVGYTILEAENGAVAWEMWSNNKCDLLITDINMPNLNGIELLKKIKATDRAFPVIVVTGVTTESLKKEAITYGADTLLAKPFKMKELIDKIVEISNDINSEQN